MKLTKTEENAKLLCNNIRRGVRKGLIVEFRKSATWGILPHIDNGAGLDCVHIRGCGYCRESTALADCLCWLFEPDTEAHIEVSMNGGHGSSSVADALARHGWKLEAVAEGKNATAYSVTKI